MLEHKIKKILTATNSRTVIIPSEFLKVMGYPKLLKAEILDNKIILSKELAGAVDVRKVTYSPRANSGTVSILSKWINENPTAKYVRIGFDGEKIIISKVNVTITIEEE